MRTLLHLILQYLLFGATMFFAAGAPPVVGDGTGAAADAGADAGADTTDTGADAGATDAGGEFEYSTEDDAVDTAADKTTDPTHKPEETKEEPELGEFKGSVTARFRKMEKDAPELFAALKKYPKIQEQLEAGFRREAAYRDVFPTVAEARQMRETFPNGLQDVQAMQADVQEVEALDKDFYTRDGEGNYPGHERILANMFQDNRQAAVALMKKMPTQWARLDADSYNETFGRIIAATLSNDGVPEYIGEMLEAAKASKNEQLAAGLGKLLNWTKRFGGEKAAPSEEQQRLAKDRQQFDQQRQTAAKEEHGRFHQSFVSSSKKLQADIITAHPALKRLEKLPSISADKRAKIVEDIRGKMEKLLSKSPSFMRKIEPAYKARNLEETTKLQKAAWSQPWLLNRMVREVMRAEMPALLGNQNRQQTRRPASPPARTPADKAGEVKHTRPYQVGKNWFHADGRRMTIEELLRGEHEK